jgi:WD40 repeat protein
MAPEQAGGKTKEIGPAADVYALGAILYELLTGRPPFKAATPLDTIMQVVSDEPAPPRQLQSKVPRDLETVCLKCVHKDPRKRYRTAADLAGDLARFQRGAPVTARRVGAIGRGWRWCRRNPAVAASLAAVFMSLAVGVGVATHFAVRANAKTRQVRRALYAAQMRLAEPAWEDGDHQRLLEILDAQLPERVGEELRGFEWYYWWRMSHSPALTAKPVIRLGEDWGEPTRLAMGSGGRYVAAYTGQPHHVRDEDRFRRGWPCRLSVWDTTSAREVWHRLGAEDREVALSRDGRRLAGAARGTHDSYDVKVWDVATDREILSQTIPWSEYRPELAFSPDGTRLAVRATNSIKVWDTARNNKESTLKDSQPIRQWIPWDGLTFSGDGKRLAARAIRGGSMQTFAIWDVDTGARQLTLEHEPLATDSAWLGTNLALSPDGRRLADSSFVEGTVRVYNAGSGGVEHTFRVQVGSVRSLAFSADGQHLCCLAGRTNPVVSEIMEWDLATGRPERFYRWNQSDVVAGVLSIDGLAFAIAGPSTIQAYELPQAAPAALAGHRSPITCMAWSPHGRWLASGADRVEGTGAGELLLWDMTTGRLLQKFQEPRADIRSITFSPDGRWLTSSGMGSKASLRVRDMVSGDEMPAASARKYEGEPVLFTPGGGRVLTRADAQVQVRDGSSGVLVRSVPPFAEGRLEGVDVKHLALDPVGQFMAMFGTDPRSKKRRLALYDLRTGHELHSLEEGSALRCEALAFSPQGEYLASGSGENAVKLWDVASGRELHTLWGHGGWQGVTALAFSPDASRLASGASDNIVKLWDVVTGQEVLTLKGHTKPVTGLAFSPDGHRLASCSEDGTVRIWDATPME